MQFNKIAKMDHVLASRAKWRFSQLTVELGVRNDNQHVGSGLGGNNFQLMVLMGMNHVLSNRQETTVRYLSQTNTLIWGASWLVNTGMKFIRPELDRVFATILENGKVAALALEAMAYSNNLRATLEKYRDQFPKLIACLSGGTYQLDDGMSNSDKLILASIMCQDLSLDLDNGSKAKVASIGAALLEFHPEIILLSVRIHIGINRLVAFDLDEDPVFFKVLTKVNKCVMYGEVG